MPAPKANQYGKGNKGGRGGPSKFKPEYIEIASRLCKRGLTDAEIAEVLGISEPTIHSWKLKHEEFGLALTCSKVVINEKVRESLLKRALGFEREVQKATASGKVVTVNEYYPPDVQAQRLWLQNRDEDFVEKAKVHHHTLTADDAFLKFLEHIEERGHEERQQPQLVDHAGAETIDVSEA